MSRILTQRRLPAWCATLSMVLIGVVLAGMVQASMCTMATGTQSHPTAHHAHHEDATPSVPEQGCLLGCLLGVEGMAPTAILLAIVLVLAGVASFMAPVEVCLTSLRVLSLRAPPRVSLS
jgi:hypothetical protein